MRANKHLVLATDVHQKLKRKKQQTGLTLTEIGNSILRSVLSRPSFGEVIGQKLVESGKISLADYKQVIADVAKEVQGIADPFADLVDATPQETLIVGSWEGKEIYKSPDGSYQLLEWWARDTQKVPARAHYHDQEGTIVVLSGEVMVEVECEKLTLGPMNSIYIPLHEAHSKTPLTDDARVLLINKPTWPDYLRKGKESD